jgi:hypothetical protein
MGVAATPPSPMRAEVDDTVVEVEREADRDARDVVEAPLRDLVERARAASGTGCAPTRMSSSGRRAVVPVAR